MRLPASPGGNQLGSRPNRRPRWRMHRGGRWHIHGTSNAVRERPGFSAHLFSSAQMTSLHFPGLPPSDFGILRSLSGEVVGGRGRKPSGATFTKHADRRIGLPEPLRRSGSGLMRSDRRFGAMPSRSVSRAQGLAPVALHDREASVTTAVLPIAPCGCTGTERVVCWPPAGGLRVPSTTADAGPSRMTATR